MEGSILKCAVEQCRELWINASAVSPSSMGTRRRTERFASVSEILRSGKETELTVDTLRHGHLPL